MLVAAAAAGLGLEELAGLFGQMYERARGDLPDEDPDRELMQSVLEIATPVCHTPAEVAEQLRQIRGYVCGIAREQGLRVGSAGTHPFSLFERQRITARDRYRALVDQMQYVARRELIFGMHIHVAVDDARQGDPGRQRAPRRTSGRCSRCPRARRSGAASRPGSARAGRWSSRRSRARGRRRASRATPTTRRSSGQLEKTGCIADYTHIWWDIRLHPRLGTIEVRICDAVTRLEHVVAIVAYCQALVKLFSERFDRGEEIPSYHRILTTENKWLAGALRARGAADGSRDRAAGTASPVAQLIRRTLKEIEPHARELGSDRELEGIEEILAQRQRRRPAATRLQREPRHRRGRERDRRRDGGRGRASAGEVGSAVDARSQETEFRDAARLDRTATSGALSTSCSRTGRRCFVFYLFDWSST